jgi:hypothetical protein
MSVPALKPPPPPPVILIATRLGDGGTYNQIAYAIIGTLEQNGWVLVRKRHQR